MIATSKRVRFTVDEYFRMSEAGVFGDKRVELINGRIVQMLSQANPHRASITRITIIFSRHFSDVKRFWLVVQGTFIIQPYGAPDPDFHVFNVPVGTPDKKLPRPFIVVEVSDTTYRRDSGSKLRQYAQTGIEDYWIVNLNQRRVEVYRKPHNPTGRQSDWRYDSVQLYDENSSVSLLAYPNIVLSVSEMLP
jgi:Uma2 family endonuclease